MAVTSRTIRAATCPVAAVFWALSVAGSVSAESGAPVAVAQSSRIPVSVVEGRLVVRCDVSTRFRRLPVNLFIDYEATCGLELHNQAASGLKSERGDGTAFPITVHLPNLDLVVERREIGDDEYLDEFTRWNSIKLGEVSVVGTIGARLLRDYHAVFDLDAGYIELSAPREREEEPSQAPEGVTRLDVSIINDIVWLPARYEGGTQAAMVLGTGSYDTTVDAFLADDLNRPAGDIGPVTLARVDLAEYVSFRPKEVDYLHPDGALGVVGMNLLESFRVEVDRVNGYVTLEAMRAPRVPEGDFDYFAAMVDEDVEGLTRFLEENDGHRLALEAARLCVTLGLIEGVSPEELAPALSQVDKACPEDLRATSALEVMKTCAAFGLPWHLIAAGRLGLEGGRDDRYPDAVHQVHARLGEVHLELDVEDEAWRHLLAAAFGLPEDGAINLNLGRLYERQNRYRRAFSRYIQAAIRPDSGPQGVEGLSRVAPLLPGGEGFSVELVERMIAGKVRNFGAATHFEADEENTAGRVVLVEFFTNSFLGNGSRGAIGGALAHEGLLGHFPPENVAFLSYHLPVPQPDPLICEMGEIVAERLRVDGPWVYAIDGIGRAPGAGKWSDAEGIYGAVRSKVLQNLLEPSDFELELDGHIEDGRVHGELVVRGPERRRTSVQVVLAERRVLFPGTTEVVVHRMLARGSLTGEPLGLSWVPTDGEMRVPFDRELASFRAGNEAYIDEVCAESEAIVRKLSMDVDPAEAVLVAFVRSSSTGAVLQAIQVDPTMAEEERP
jgi:hypothetical protein